MYKPLNERYAQRIRHADMNIVKTKRWLKSVRIEDEDKGLIIAALQQSPPTRNYQAHMIKKQPNPISRQCEQKTESIDLFASGCPIPTAIKYIERHDKIGRYIVIFWPSPRPKNAILRWYTGRKWHIPMASNRKRSRGRIKAFDMGQGEGPIMPLQWCTGRE